MRFGDLMEHGPGAGTYSAEEAKEIGSCAIIAISHITGLSWDEVFEVGKKYFGKHGLNSGDTWAILRDLGWHSDGYFKIPGFITPKGVTVRDAELWLRENDPEVKLLAVIYVDRVPHAIAYTDGQFHNVLGANRAKLRLASICYP